MTEQQVEKIIEHLESIMISLDYIAIKWADGTEETPIHYVYNHALHNQYRG